MDKFAIEYDEKHNDNILTYRGITLFRAFHPISVDEIVSSFYNPQLIIEFLDAVIDGNLFDHFMNNTFMHYVICVNKWPHLVQKHVNLINVLLYVFTDNNRNELFVKQTNIGYDFIHNNKTVSYAYGNCVWYGKPIKCTCDMCNMIIRNAFYKNTKSAVRFLFEYLQPINGAIHN